MKQLIRLFARARDIANAPTVEIDLPPNATVYQLRQEIAKRYPALASLLERSALAVNGEFANDATPVPPGCELAVLPPVSGG